MSRFTIITPIQGMDLIDSTTPAPFGLYTLEGSVSTIAIVSAVIIIPITSRLLVRDQHFVCHYTRSHQESLIDHKIPKC